MDMWGLGSSMTMNEKWLCFICGIVWCCDGYDEWGVVALVHVPCWWWWCCPEVVRLWFLIFEVCEGCLRVRERWIGENIREYRCWRFEAYVCFLKAHAASAKKVLRLFYFATLGIHLKMLSSLIREVGVCLYYFAASRTGFWMLLCCKGSRM